MDNIERRNIILENYKNPLNKGLVKDETYLCSNTNNESCIDEVNLMVKIENNKIIDIRFDGEACVMCTSSSSIMIKTLLNKSLKEAFEIYNNFTNMIDGKDYNKLILNECLVFDDIIKQPSRKTCVMLPWLALKKILDQVN